MELNKETEYVSEAVESLTTHGNNLPPRLEDVERLYRLGVWSRGSTLPRGQLDRPAPNRLGHDGSRLSRILVHWVGVGYAEEIRRKAALAAGNWCGEECVSELRSVLVANGTDSVTKLYCISALKTIGGVAAVGALTEALAIADFQVQEAAVAALFELASGGSVSDVDPVPKPPRKIEKPLPPLLRYLLSRRLEALERAEAAPLAVRYGAEKGLSYLTQAEALTPQGASSVSSLPTSEPVPPVLEARPAGVESQYAYLGEVPVQAAERPKASGVVSATFVRGAVQEEAVLLDILPGTGKALQALVPGNLFYLRSTNDGIVVTLRVRQENFPEKAAGLRVLLDFADGSVAPVDETTTLRADEQHTFQFPLSDEHIEQFCRNPKFRLIAA